MASSLESATPADLKLAELYLGPVSWVGDRDDGDAIKVVFERADGAFETFTVGNLRACAWWRMGRPDDIVALEALMATADGVEGNARDAGQRERRRCAILAAQAAVRMRLAAV